MATIDTSVSNEEHTADEDRKDEILVKSEAVDDVQNDEQSTGDKNDDANDGANDNDVKIKIEDHNLTVAIVDNANDRSNDRNNNDMPNDSGDDSNEKTNLIVNYLPQHMTDEEFEDLFKKFGAMKSCKIVRNRSTGYSYGFGFVDFETHEQALQAIDELNGHELNDKKIKVAFARPAGQDIKQANLYIKNVPNNWTQDDVRKVFEPFGNIIQVRVLGNDRNVAFVLYDLRKQAEDALEAMNGKKLDECEAPFEIKFAADKKVEKGGGSVSGGSRNNNNNNNSNPRSGRRGRRGGRNQNRDSNKQRSGSQGGGGGRGQHGSQRSASSSSGGSFFNRNQERRGNNNNNNNQYGNNGFGPVRQQSSNRMNRYSPFVSVQQQQMPTLAPAPQMAVAPAYAYQPPMMPTYMMATNQQAMIQPMAATQQMQQMNPMNAYQMPGGHQMPTMGGYAPVAQNAMNNIYSVASNTMQNAAQMQPQLGQPMNMRDQKPNYNHGNSNNNNSSNNDGITLFVYNIGPNSDENELKEMFSSYGNIVKCNVVRKTPGGETKGFGFVTLKSKDQADLAISGLNGTMRNGRTLQVSLKK